MSKTLTDEDGNKYELEEVWVDHDYSTSAGVKPGKKLVYAPQPVTKKQEWEVKIVDGFIRVDAGAEIHQREAVSEAIKGVLEWLNDYPGVGDWLTSAEHLGLAGRLDNAKGQIIEAARKAREG